MRCGFTCIPSVKASRLSDARGVMLVLPNRDVWTFEALDDKVELEDSVFLAGNDGPRRTAQIVIRQDSRHASSIRWSFVRSTRPRPPPPRPAATRAASRNCRCRSLPPSCERIAQQFMPSVNAAEMLLTALARMRLATLDGAPSGSAGLSAARLGTPLTSRILPMTDHPAA